MKLQKKARKGRSRRFLQGHFNTDWQESLENRGAKMRYGLLFAALTILLWTTSGVQAADPEPLSYEDFIQKVQEGQVKSISPSP